MQYGAVFDVDSDDPGAAIPSDMLEKTEKYAPDIVRVRVQRQPAGKKSWNLIKSGRKLVKGTKTAEEICEIALGFVRKDQDSAPEDGVKYRAYYDVEADDGSISHKYAVVDTTWDGDELMIDDGEPDLWNTPVERALAESLDQERALVRRQGALLLDTWDRFSSVVERMGNSQAALVTAQASVGTAMAEGHRGTAEAMTQAGELYRQGQARTVEQERLRLEAQLMNREMDESNQKWDLLKQGLPLAAMAVAKQLGIPMETAIQLVQLMAMLSQSGSEGEMMAGLQGGAQAITGGGGGAMPGLPPGVTPEQVQAMQMQAMQAQQAQAAQAAQAGAQAQPVTRPAGWQYPGPLDLDDVPDDVGLSVDLGAWFAERDEHEEREVRAIVEGIEPGLYDALRTAPTHGAKAAQKTLTAFAVRVDGLGLGAIGVLGRLRAALGGATDGAAAVTEFQTLMNRARTGAG